MAQIIKTTGINISRNEKGELLLKLSFKNIGSEGSEQYSWMPTWGTVRELVLSAMVVEAINSPNSYEFQIFESCFQNCRLVTDKLVNMLMGQYGIEE